MEEMKKCPACAEDIKEEAKKCRYCNTTIKKENVEVVADKISFGNVILYILAFIFIISGVSSIYGATLLITGIGCIPQVIKQIRKKYKSTKKFGLKYGGSLFCVFFFGALISGIIGTSKSLSEIKIAPNNIVKSQVVTPTAKTKKEESEQADDQISKEARSKQNSYPKREINDLVNEMYQKYKNKEEVDRVYYREHIIYGEGKVVDIKYSGKAAMVLFNLSKKSTLDDDVFSNPYIVKVKGDSPLNVKIGDTVKFSGPIGSLGGDHNSPGGNSRWAIYLDSWKNKDYTFITKIY